jgi:hypothetical protein
VSEVTTELVIGAQSRAAQQVSGSGPVLEAALRALATGIQAELAGFGGNVAGNFYQALEAWFKVGATIPQATYAYGAKLLEVDQTVGESQVSQGATYQRVAGSLSAWSIE